MKFFGTFFQKNYIADSVRYTAGKVGDCENENNATLSKQFFGCGMQHACDGDEGKGEDYASWCFTEDGCGYVNNRDAHASGLLRCPTIHVQGHSSAADW